MEQCLECGELNLRRSGSKYCSDKCRVTNQRKKAKQTRGEVRKMFSEREFKEYVIQDSDKIDFSMKDLSNYKYFPSKIKQQMIIYKIIPRLAKQETSTIRGIWRRKSSVINIAELIELYNVKVEKFRNYPQLNVFNSIIGISKTIDYARRKWNEKL